MAIKLTFPNTSAGRILGDSHFWGMADLPKNTLYPETIFTDGEEQFADPMMLVCQIKCEEIAPFDKDNLLPHSGLLSFFAAIDFYLEHEDVDADGYNGIGEWSRDMFRVIWSEDTSDLHTHFVNDDDGMPYGLKAEAIKFDYCPEQNDGFKMLGKPYYDEVLEQTAPDLISLLQIDESDEWNLRFYDCGMLNFLISKEDLEARRFDRVRCYLHSF